MGTDCSLIGWRMDEYKTCAICGQSKVIGAYYNKKRTACSKCERDLAKERARVKQAQKVAMLNVG